MNTPKRPVVLVLIAFLSALGFAWGEIIAPGVEYTVYNLPHPNVAYVVKLDLSCPEYKLKMGFPQKKRNYSAREVTSTIFSRYDNPPSHDALVAVNAGFFGTGIDINGSLGGTNGYIQLPTNTYETYMFTDARTSRIERNVSSTGSKVTFANATTLAIDKINYTRDVDQLIVYTTDWDTSTRTTVEGTEVVLSNVSYPMRPDKEVSGIVMAVRTGAQSLNNAIPAGGMVLSASGTKAATLASNVSVGDRVKVWCDVSSTIYLNSRLIATGAGWILYNGAANTSTWGYWSDSFKGRNPRTMLSWNNTHLFLVAVDGRQTFSVGMTFQEMADFLLSIGCTDAINLDGGGSTTMVVDGTVVNSPSGGTQRAVGNAIILVKQDTATTFPLQDSFPSTGRTLPWEDKFVWNGVSAFSPTAPGGDGYAITVKDPSGGAETVELGDLADTDYGVEAQVYCEYRPEVSGNGYERYGIFARDNGNFAFTLTSYGGGNCYLMTYDSNNGRVRAGKVVGGTLTDYLQSTPLYYTTTAWRKLAIECTGSNVLYFLNDSLIANVTDPSFSRGYSGIGFHEFFTTNSNMHGTRADNFRAYSLGPSATSVSTAKNASIGAPVHLGTKTLTAAFPSAGIFYVANDGEPGSQGIAVLKNALVPTMPSVGQKMNLVGTLGWASAPYDKELIVTPSRYAVVSSGWPVTPAAMNNRASGGTGLGSQQGVIDDVGTSQGAFGLSSVGTLVTVWGRLTSGGSPGQRFCWIDDGSGLNDGTGTGIRVDLSELGNNLPASGSSYYLITGIMRCAKSDGPEALPIRVLWPRSAADVTPVP